MKSDLSTAGIPEKRVAAILARARGFILRLVLMILALALGS